MDNSLQGLIVLGAGDMLPGAHDRSPSAICVTCGFEFLPITKTEVHKGAARPARPDSCGACNFWLDAIEGAKRRPGSSFVMNGSMYIMGAQGRDVPARLRGMGGRRYYVLFEDGRTATTVDLWHKGEVYVHMYERVLEHSPRARTVSIEEWERAGGTRDAGT